MFENIYLHKILEIFSNPLGTLGLTKMKKKQKSTLKNKSTKEGAESIIFSD